MMERVLVVGGAGYVGSHSAKALFSAGYDPVVLDNLTAGHRWAVQWGDFVEGDFGDHDLLCATLRRYRISTVLHFAAHAYVGESMRHPDKYFQNNVTNTLTLLRSMLSTGVHRIVFSSSCATYGSPADLPITESTPQNPVNPYGESKLMVEKILRSYADAYHLNSVCLRYFNACGADPETVIGECHNPETHLIPSVIETALHQRSAVDVYGTDYSTSDGTAVRDYVHVADLADAHVRSMDYLNRHDGFHAFNLGTGNGFSVRDVIRSVERISGRRVNVRYQSRRPGDPPELVAQPSSARRELKWKPAFTSLDDIVETAWKWHSKGNVHARAAGI
jgi:UDP-glucose-4-epimerase GalE